MSARDFALRAVQAGFGYACAAAAATAVTVIVLFVYALATQGGGGMDVSTGFLNSLLLIVFYGFIFIFITALPGFLVTLLVSAATGLRGWAFFAIAGALGVFPAWAIFEALSRPDPDQFGVLLFSDRPLVSLPGGFLGGLTYWYVRRRLRDAPTSPAPSGS